MVRVRVMDEYWTGYQACRVPGPCTLPGYTPVMPVLHRTVMVRSEVMDGMSPPAMGGLSMTGLDSPTARHVRSCYGYDRDSSPTRHYSYPVTQPRVTPLFGPWLILDETRSWTESSLV